MKINIIKMLSVISLALGFSTIALAEQSQPEWFVDHVRIAPLKHVTIRYSIPTAKHFMICIQDASDSNLASVEWTYQTNGFNSQLLRKYAVNFMRSDYPAQEIWKLPATTQFIDPAGTINITNLDEKEDLVVSCVYDLNLE